MTPPRRPVSEFPNDNPALHEGAVWVCLVPGGPLRAIVRPRPERPAEVDVPAEPELAQAPAEALTPDEAPEIETTQLDPSQLPPQVELVGHVLSIDVPAPPASISQLAVDDEAADDSSPGPLLSRLLERGAVTTLASAPGLAKATPRVNGPFSTAPSEVSASPPLSEVVDEAYLPVENHEEAAPAYRHSATQEQTPCNTDYVLRPAPAAAEACPAEDVSVVEHVPAVAVAAGAPVEEPPVVELQLTPAPPSGIRSDIAEGHDVELATMMARFLDEELDEIMAELDQERAADTREPPQSTSRQSRTDNRQLDLFAGREREAQADLALLEPIELELDETGAPVSDVPPRVTAGSTPQPSVPPELLDPGLFAELEAPAEEDDSPISEPGADAYESFLTALSTVAMEAGSSRAAAVLPLLLGDGRVDATALPDAAVTCVAERGIARVRGSLLQTTPEFRAVAEGWGAVLRGTSDDLAACGSSTLDGWGAELLAALLGDLSRSNDLRRELRKKGVAAFGMLVRAA